MDDESSNEGEEPLDAEPSDEDEEPLDAEPSDEDEEPLDAEPSDEDEEPLDDESSEVEKPLDDGEANTDEETVRVWLVERTYSDDEQNMLILVYATPDGTRYHRKERALTSLHGGVPGTEVSLGVPHDQLGDVTDPDEREYYASAASRTATNNDPDDVV